RAVVDELRAASAMSPLLLVLDDLHVADVSTLRMLQFVSRELRGVGGVILATRRDTDPAMTPDIESTLARIAREGRSLVLARLGREDVARFVREAGPTIAGAWEESIWNATEGNPLFVGEMVHVLEAQPGLRAAP